MSSTQNSPAVLFHSAPMHQGGLEISFPTSWRLAPAHLQGPDLHRLSKKSSDWASELRAAPNGGNDIYQVSTTLEILQKAHRLVVKNPGMYEVRFPKNIFSSLSNMLDEGIAALPDSEFEALFQIKEPLPGLLVIEMPTEPLLCASFMRFQERYESPHSQFRGKPFARADYHAFYATQDTAIEGQSSYYVDWSGFNLPGSVLAESIDFPNLTRAEKKLIELVASRLAVLPKCYVIGLGASADQDTRDHEVRHGLYYLDEEYRSQVDAACSRSPALTRELKNWLLEHEYAEERIPDELQAYLGMNLDELSDLSGCSVNSEAHWGIHREIQEAEQKALRRAVNTAPN